MLLTTQAFTQTPTPPAPRPASIFRPVTEQFSPSPTRTMNPYDRIIPYICVGNLEACKKYCGQFDLIVNCTRDIPFYCNDATAAQTPAYIRISVNDSPDECKSMLAQLASTHALEEIHQAVLNKKPVLIHCFAGAQRSCAVMACYLMKYHGMTPETAIATIRNQRMVAFFGGVNFKDALNAFYRNKST